MTDTEEWLRIVDAIQDMLINHATGGRADGEEYARIRELLISNEPMRLLLPRYVVSCRTPDQFWAYIKPRFSTYQERREYIWESFLPLINKLEGRAISPVDQSVSDILSKLDIEHIGEIWQRALSRRFEEPDAAITAARTMLESTCKVLLDELGESYTDKDDLPKLYRRVADNLNLAPDLHTEQIFKQILGGCQAIVEGLGAVRNKLSDAHGKGKRPVRPDQRHAELAVNLAGAMAVFLARTWEHYKKQTT